MDEPRYPTIGVQLERAPFVASASLTSDVLDADVGDKLTLTSLPAWLPPQLRHHRRRRAHDRDRDLRDQLATALHRDQVGERRRQGHSAGETVDLFQPSIYAI